jgi:hypothetical protein
MIVDNKNKLDGIVLFIIAILVVAICVYTPSNTNNIQFDKGSTLYEQFPDAYENTSFNPKNGYIGNSYER